MLDLIPSVTPISERGSCPLTSLHPAGRYIFQYSTNLACYIWGASGQTTPCVLARVLQAHLATCKSSREGGWMLHELFRKSSFEKVLKCSTCTSVLTTSDPEPLSSLCAVPVDTCHPGKSQVSTLLEAQCHLTSPCFFILRSPSVHSACVGI